MKGSCVYGAGCRYEHVKPKINNKEACSSSSTSSSVSVTPSASVSATNINNNNKCEQGLQQLSVSPYSNSNMLILSKKKSSNENELNSSASNEEISNNSNGSKSYFEALTGAKLPLNNNPYSEFDPFDESTANQQVMLDQYSMLCPFFEKDASCPFGLECQYLHGEVCDLCGTPCLHPFNEELREQHKKECTKQIEADMEEAFATQRSQEKQCGICMEIVWEKEKSEQCFGLLENCNHIFCLQCIRKWRASKTYENKIVK